MYTTFLLDLDHTLFDTEASETAAFEYAMQSAGEMKWTRLLAPYQRINLDLWAAVERGELAVKRVRDLRFERLVEQFDLPADPRQLADDFVTGLGEYGGLYAGAREVLEQLGEVAALALVTNGLGEVQRRRLARLDLESVFGAVAISAELGVAKPENGIFDYVFETLGEPDRNAAVMVGDNLSADIVGGANYGIATCWYNPTGAAADSPVRISHEIRSLSELPALARR